MTFFSHLKPKFWDHVDPDFDSRQHPFFFRRLWKKIILITLAAALVPVMVMGAINYQVNRDDRLQAMMRHTLQLTNNSGARIDHFLRQRKAVLDFIHHNHRYEELVTEKRLRQILISLQKNFSGFMDLEIIDQQGIQVAQAGSVNPISQTYGRTDWFQKVTADGLYFSHLLSGVYRKPHLFIAVKQMLSAKRFYILRAALDGTAFNHLLSELAMDKENDAFVINRNGTLQSDSREHGAMLSRCSLNPPKYSKQGKVEIIFDADNSRIIRGYAHIPDTPFLLMVVSPAPAPLAVWERHRKALMFYFLPVLMIVLLALLGTVTHLVHQTYLADQRRLVSMHQAEYANKMSSIARLSAGVAHEINNPLAIINEKAGLIKDLFTYKREYAEDPKLMGLIDSVLAAVTRSAGITRRLLNFVSRSRPMFQSVDLLNLFKEVLIFWGKEAEYRSIDIKMEIDERIPIFRTDPNCLQEVIFNLFTNAFAAMDDGGRLHISATILESRSEPQAILVKISDTGHGIPASDLEKIFEPFYSTKLGKSGTGLGLSITYGMVQELGGKITAHSELGHGATFEIRLPLYPPKSMLNKENEFHENIIGG